MQYTTYWSLLDSQHTVKLTTVSLCIAIGFGMIWTLLKKFRKNTNDNRILYWTTGSFSLLGFVMYILMAVIYRGQSEMSIYNMIDSLTTQRVEGVVSNFERKFRYTRFGSQTIECFTVDSVPFAYGDTHIKRFNSFSETYNTIIFNGQKVRITYGAGSLYGDQFNTILKLEIEQ